MIRTCIVVAMLVFGTVPADAGSPRARSANPQDKMICRSFPAIGSLVSRNRVCKTKAEWQKDRDLLRERVGVNSCARQPCEVPGK
jgi:hypothetical protein